MSGGLIDWRALFFSADGRCARGPTWVAMVLLLLLSGLYESVAVSTLRYATFWFVYPGMLACASCVLSKRLHDRGRSGWWAALVLLASIMLWPTLHGAQAIATVPVMLWALVELGVMPSEQGGNRFGPNPYQNAQV